MLALKTIGERLAWGARWGAIVGSVYCGLAFLILLARGDEPFEQLEVTFFDTVLTYMAGGIIGGCIVGLMRPMARSRAGSATIGFFAALPVATMAGATQRSSSSSMVIEVAVTVIFALLVGVPVGLIFHASFLEQQRPNDRP